MSKKQTKTERPKIEKREKDFVPGDETEDQFDKVVSLLSEWLKAGIVSVDVAADGDITFGLPREMNKLLETQVPPDLSHEKVRAIVRNEIPVLIAAGLERNPEQKLRFVMPEKLHGKIVAMTGRCEKAVATLVDATLKERILLRKTTLSYVLDDVHGIQSTFHVESGKGENIDLPFISLELSLAKPRSGYTLAARPWEGTISFARKDDVRVTIDLHKDDLKDFIQKLSKIEQRVFIR